MLSRFRRFGESLSARIIGSTLAMGSLETSESAGAAAQEIMAPAGEKKETEKDGHIEIMEKRNEGKEHFQETDIVQKELYDVLPKINYTLFRQHLPEQLRGMTDAELTGWIKARAQTLAKEVDADIATKRFPHPGQETHYFSRLQKESSREKIREEAVIASALTGVPYWLLIGIGCMESQWNLNAENPKTEVYGPMQMKFATAQQIAKHMNEEYDISLRVNSPEDLKNIEIAVLLAAGYLQSQYEKYGQWGLAAVAYASGPGVLDDKIKNMFPDIHFGYVEGRKRAEHSRALTNINEQKKTVRGQLKKDPKNSVLLSSLVELERQWREQNNLYAVYQKKEADCLRKLSEELAHNGVTIFTLGMSDVCSPDGAQCGNLDKHSLAYAINIDAMAARAEHYMADKKPTIVKK